MKQTIGDFVGPLHQQDQMADGAAASGERSRSIGSVRSGPRDRRLRDRDRGGHDNEAGGVGWKWSIYRGKAEWYSYLVEAVWTPVNYAAENEARAAAWSALVRIWAGPEWPHEPAVRTFDDVFEFPEDKAKSERARRNCNDPKPDRLRIRASRLLEFGSSPSYGHPDFVVAAAWLFAGHH